MQVAGHLRQPEAELRDLLQRPLEQLVVVRLEVDGAALGQHLPVFLQEVPVGQPPLLLVALGPRVAEVDIQPVDLALREHVRQQRGIAVHEPHVVYTGVPRLLHGHHHGVGYLFHGNEQHIRLRCRRAHRKAALAAAQFHPQLTGGGHQLPPPSAHGEGVFNKVHTAGFHSGSQVFLFAHPHIYVLAISRFSPIIPHLTPGYKHVFPPNPVPATCPPEKVRKIRCLLL